MAKILIADDDKNLLRLLSYTVEKLGYKTVLARDGQEVIDLFVKTPVDAVMLDVNMPHRTGIEALEIIKEKNPAMPVVMVSALHDISLAVKAIKLGAYEYLTKPIDESRLATVLRNAVQVHGLREEVKVLQHKLSESELFSEIIGESKKLEDVFQLVNRVLNADVNVMIIGESGTGKELIARAIHRGSRWSSGPFVAVNSAAITNQLADSLLFGHNKGAFTGATEDRPGYFEQANGGTIFLDEIGDMDAEIQARVLRILQDKKVRRVGETQERTLSFRVIAATNVDLSRAVEQNRFREDLYFRLEEFPVYLPPLRERGDDVLPLAQHFMREFCNESQLPEVEFSEDAIRELKAHDWPGNIRELKNTIKRTVLQSSGAVIRQIFFSQPRKKAEATVAQPVNSEVVDLKNQEKESIEKALQFTNYKAGDAARLLGISRATMYRKLKKYNLDSE
jgi:DNA-binding NtrC family response regulator